MKCTVIVNYDVKIDDLKRIKISDKGIIYFIYSKGLSLYPIDSIKEIIFNEDSSGE